MSSSRTIRRIAVASALSLGAGVALQLPAQAQNAADQQNKPEQRKPEQRSMDEHGVQQQLARATAAVERMKADPQAMALLKKARGIFVVPNYVRAGLGVGGSGGEGVMLAKRGSGWTSPLFYNVGGVSIGLQAGAEAGPVVMLLMNDKAVSEFRKENNFALNADAGLTLVDYKAKAAAEAGQGDVAVWTDTKGAFATAAIGIVDIHFDDADNRAYYRKDVSAVQVMGGKVKDAQPGMLARALGDGKAG